MKRILVIGCPGSGKSTFSRALRDKVNLPLVHLDLLYWNADGTTVPKAVFLRRLQETLAEDTWIIDGNYASTMELRLQACDTVFFLDYPVEVCLKGIQERKGKKRADLPWVEPMEDDEEFLSMVRNFREAGRPAIVALLHKYAQKNIVVLHSREEGAAFLTSLQEK